MSKETQTPTELWTLTPELGLFVIRGQFDDLKDQEQLMSQEPDFQLVTPSKFNRVLAGGKLRRLQLF